ncbi:hypothetical protein AAFN86_03885 [Roseomonas sp. CAU 1739]|uniref:hypothetical protein n=1 Tax=Roseomonas sp. CAU 1739 TaxID=3140364 RepID=UPI00325A5D84
MLGCAPDPGETTALLQHALASTQASLALTGGARPAAPVAAAPPAAPSPQPAWVPGAARPRGSAPPAAAAALVGVTADHLRRMLGEPSIRRPEGTAEVWLYEAPACRLDVILFAEGSSLVVGHAAARAVGGADGVTEAACLGAMAAAPAARPWTAPGPHA